MPDQGGRPSHSAMRTPLAGPKQGVSLAGYALVAIGGLLATSVLLLFAIKLHSRLTRTPADYAITPPRSIRIQQAESATAFRNFAQRGSDTSSLSEQQRAEFQSAAEFFRNFEDPDNPPTGRRLRDLIDFDRLLARIDATGRIADWTDFEKRALRTELKEQVGSEINWPAIQIAAILTPRQGEPLRIVYALSSPESEGATEYRFLMTRQADSWRLYDWERLDLGVSLSEEYSIYCKYVDSPLLEALRRWNAAIAETDRLTGEGDYEAAKAALRRGEAETVPPELHGYQIALTSYRWATLGESEEAVRCCRQASDPRATPGVLFSLMRNLRSSNPTEALAHAEAYEAAVGPSPDLLAAKIGVLEELGLSDKVQTARRMLLRMQPDNTMMMVAYLDSLPDDRKSAIDELLAQRDDPVAAAAELLPMVRYRDVHSLAYLVDYLQRHAPRRPATSYAAGTVLQLEGDYEAAAQRYRSAFQEESDKELRQTYFDAFVTIMVELDQVMDALRLAPDQQAALESLLFSYDEGDIVLKDDEYATIVDFYAQKFPHEQDALQRQARLAMKKERHDAAHALLERALERLPPAIKASEVSEQEFDETAYEREAVQRLLAEVTYKQGRLRQAYDYPGDKDDRLELLANLAMADKRWDSVRQLLAWHRAEQGNQADGLFVEARLAEKEGDRAAAIDLYARALDQTPDSERWYRDMQFRQLCLEEGQPLEYYRRSTDPGEAYSELADELIANHRWKDFDELEALHRKNHPDDKQLEYTAANAAWERAELLRFIFLATNLRRDFDELELSHYQKRGLEQRLLTALLLHNRYQLARELADEQQKTEGNWAWTAAVHAAGGNTTRALEAALRTTEAASDTAELYRNDAVAPRFLDAVYRPLHEKVPVDLPYNIASLLAVFHSSDPWQLRRDQVESAVDRLHIGAEVVELSTFDPRVQDAFAVQLDSSCVWLATGSGRLEEHWRPANGDASAAKVMGEQGHWFAVGFASWRESNRQMAAGTARRLALELVDDQAETALLYRSVGYGSQVLVPARPQVLDHWQSTVDTSPLKPFSLDLEYVAASDHVSETRHFDRSLREAVAKRNAKPGSSLTVWATPTGTPRLDPIALEITQATSSLYSVEFQGTLHAPAQLFPELKPGLPMEFSDFEVVAWQLDDQPIQHRP